MIDAVDDELEGEEARAAHAARLGMWIFVGGELLLFSVLLTLYAAERAGDPRGFAAGVAHGARAIGTVNTFVLLASSAALALAVCERRDGAASRRARRRAALLTLATAALGALFLTLKGVEYAEHWHEGLRPGFVADASHGAVAFWTLYWVATGLHAVHVGVGVVLLLASSTAGVLRPWPATTSAFENVALYWHTVDAIWIVLWPLFYLAGAAG